MPVSRGRRSRRGRRGNGHAMPPTRHKRAPVHGVTPEMWCSLTWGELGTLEPAGREGASIIGNMIQNSAQKFRERFGREPHLNDPVFFDTTAVGDTPQFRDAKTLQSDMIEEMQQAEIPGHLVYAYAKTGLTLSEQNQHLLSREQMQQWNRAMAEYEAVETQDRQPDRSYRIDELSRRLADELTPMVERKPTITPLKTGVGCLIEFDSALYRLELRPVWGIDLEETDRVHVRLLHWCFAKYLEANQSGCQINMAEPHAAAKKINDHLFRRIPEIIRAGWEGYEGKDDDDIILFENAYRRRILAQIWQRFDEDGEADYGPDVPFFVGDISVPAPLGDWTIDRSRDDEWEDGETSYCLGYIVRFFDDLQQRGVFSEYGIEDWRAHFYHPPVRSDLPPDGHTEVVPPCAIKKPDAWRDAEEFVERNASILIDPNRRLSEIGDTGWTAADVERMLFDVRSLGIGGYPSIIDDEKWIAVHKKLLTDLGPEKYLRSLLAALHENLAPGAAVPYGYR